MSFLLLASISTNVLFIALYTSTMIEFNNRVVFDIDKVRKMYIDNVRLAYMHGCQEGTDYPEEWKAESKTGWSKHSPNHFCTDLREQYEEKLTDDLGKIGR